MPWHIGEHADCNGFAVIKDSDGSVAGCHETRSEAENQMAALYATEDDVTENRAEYKMNSTGVQELDIPQYSIGTLSTIAREAFRIQYNIDVMGEEMPYEKMTWIRDVFVGHPRLGDSVIAERGTDLYHVPMNLSGDAPTFSDDWRLVRATYEFVETEPVSVAESQLSETATGHVIAVEEAETPTGDLVPLTLDVVLIEPGPGNAQDGHFYPAEVLRRDAGVFKGAKMFATDHRQEDKNMGTWVSTVKACPVGFTKTGGPIARVIVHKEWFAKDCRALQKEGLLDRMECSIIGTGKAKTGKVGETEYSIVESIMEGGADWVTRAGAGGRALAIAESDISGGENVTKDKDELEEVAEDAKTVTLREDDETTEQPEIETEAQDDEPKADQTEDEPEAEDEETEENQDALSAESVNGLLAESGLGADAIKMLAARPYQAEQEVTTAIEEMTDMIKRLTGSGQPFAQGQTSPVTVQERTPQEEVEAYRSLKEKWGGRYEYKVEE